MIEDPKALEADIAAAHTDLVHLKQALDGVIVGQSALVTDLIIGVFAGGHVLMEGLPGLGKTHLAKGLAGALGFGLGRIQCTPDLMPGDITGSEILSRDAAGYNRLEFRPGPIFSHLVLVDEINRATPKTQAALLEGMQERQVTCAGVGHPLPDPFWVVATQNPIEIEGTYPLPEAQLDRFLVKLKVDFPDAQALLAILAVSLDAEPADHMTRVLDERQVQRILASARRILVAEPLKRAAVDLILATHPGVAGGHSAASRHFRYGASPRGLQALLRASRVRALLNGRLHVSVGDLRRTALPTLRHRVLPTMESELDGVNPDTVLTSILDDWQAHL